MVIQIPGYGIWIPGYGIWIPGYGIWIPGYGIQDAAYCHSCAHNDISMIFELQIPMSKFKKVNFV
jgi:hypothetical protein